MTDHSLPYFSVINWRTKEGQQIQECAPPFGFALPEGVPRFVGNGLAIAAQIGAPAGTGVQIPYQFIIEAQNVAEAFEKFAELAAPAAQQAYNTWIGQQTRKNILGPGARHGEAGN